MKICQVKGCNKEVVGYKYKKTCCNEHRLLFIKQKDRERYARLRGMVLAHYGGKCACCGESRREFLALDHRNGGGEKHRKELGGASSKEMCAWAIKNGFPDIFRILCHNCNMALGCFGYCPHQKEKAEQRASQEDGLVLSDNALEKSRSSKGAS
jgi:hypothetical protein